MRNKFASGEKNPMKSPEIAAKFAGDKCHLWRGEEVGYAGIHAWLRKHFGKANKCEMCHGFYKIYEWSKIHGVNYERKRENFWMLCRSCHRKYDWKQVNSGNFRKGQIHSSEWYEKMMGRVPWNKGLTGFTPWNKGKKGVQVAWNKGIPNSGFKKGHTPWSKGLKIDKNKFPDMKRISKVNVNS